MDVLLLSERCRLGAEVDLDLLAARFVPRLDLLGALLLLPPSSTGWNSKPPLDTEAAFRLRRGKQGNVRHCLQWR